MICILDRKAIDKGDISWAGFRECGRVALYESTSPAEVAGRAEGAHTLVTVGTPITRELLERCPDVRFINLLSTGFDFVDLAAACERGILVSNVPAYGSESVAQFVFALLLELCHRVGVHDGAVRENRWQESGTFSFWLTPLTELRDKVLGIVGFGRIGRSVARIGSAFGMRVLAHDRYATPGEDDPVQMSGLEELLAESDVVTLHCPLTAETRGMINRDAIRGMKPGVLFINCARGGLVVEEDLCAALNSGQIGGAALDVVAHEPIEAGNSLLSARNTILTPHMAWATKEARARMVDQAVANQKAFQQGLPINVVCN